MVREISLLCSFDFDSAVAWIDMLFVGYVATLEIR